MCYINVSYLKMGIEFSLLRMFLDFQDFPILNNVESDLKLLSNIGKK